MKRVVLICIPSHLPDNFSYTCFQPPQMLKVPFEKEREGHRLMGNEVVELPDDQADDLCKRAGAAIMLQIEIAKLYGKAERSK